MDLNCLFEACPLGLRPVKCLNIYLDSQESSESEQGNVVVQLFTQSRRNAARPVGSLIPAVQLSPAQQHLGYGFASGTAIIDVGALVEGQAEKPLVHGHAN